MAALAGGIMEACAHLEIDIARALKRPAARKGAA